MFDINNIDSMIKKLFHADITEKKAIGKGISGEVWKVAIDKSPFTVAVKTAKDAALLKKESDYIQYIYNKVDIKLPKIYYTNIEENESYMIMEFFDGFACSDELVLNASDEIRLNLASEIADNIAKLQNVHNTSYGELLNPQYSNWNDYYHAFTKKILAEGFELEKSKLIESPIQSMLQYAYDRYQYVFDEPASLPTLIHGDYWTSNIIANKSFHLIGVVDPFNAMWADSEYELFGLNAVYGDKIPVLEAFLKKHKVSKKFTLKNEYYFFFSEVYWVTIMKHDNNKYLNEIKGRLQAEFKKFNID